jgi:TolB protein
MTTLTRTLLLMFLCGGTVLALAMPAPVLPIVSRPLQQGQADVAITMTQAGGHPKLALPDFLGTSGDAELTTLGRTIADVLWNDLDYEREYTMIPRKVTASVPLAAADALPYPAWTEMGAESVLVGSIRREGGNVTIDIRMIVVKAPDQGRQLFGARYQNCRPQNPRLCAHSIADDFHKQTRGLDGIARTKIAFASDRANARVAGRPSQTNAVGKEIYVCDYDGANPVRVTVNGSINAFPAWSPNGSLLAFVSWMSGFPDIYVANLAEPGRPLAKPAAGNPGVQNWTPAWSPDGTRIAFASTRSGSGYTDIWIVNRDGGGLLNITNTPRSSEGTPTWSPPDGAQIAFTSDKGGTNQLYVMSATGTGEQKLATQKVDRPTWSRLGFIAFTVETTAGHDIGIYDFSSPGVKILTDGLGSNESPSVAPNGRHIAFFTTRWGRQEIATIDRTGEHVRRLTEVGSNTYPNWQSFPAQP